MRIIDKNHDFYDYLQDPTDNRIIFDRRNSFLLEKKHVCKAMHVIDTNKYCGCNMYWEMYIQCGAMIWAFLLTATEYGGEYIYPNIQAPTDYDVEFLTSWKNYDIPSKIVDVHVDTSNYADRNWRTRKIELVKDNISPERIRRSFEYRINDKYSRGIGESASTLTVTKYNETKTYDIPLLRGCGVANLINPVDVFCAIEEHFSRQITAAERTEPLGATNNDKIIMHGFDTKTSFRGKQK